MATSTSVLFPSADSAGRMAACLSKLSMPGTNVLSEQWNDQTPARFASFTTRRQHRQRIPGLDRIELSLGLERVTLKAVSIRTRCGRSIVLSLPALLRLVLSGSRLAPSDHSGLATPSQKHGGSLYETRRAAVYGAGWGIVWVGAGEHSS